MRPLIALALDSLTIASVALAVPTGPGLGIALDWDKVERFRRDGPSRTVAGAK